MYKLCFFCPTEHTEAVKEAIFSAGGGTLGAYDRCSWQTLGQGQFQAKKGANPSVGEIGILETVAEYKVEILVSEDNLDDAITALCKRHPYEEPAWEVYKIHLP